MRRIENETYDLELEQAVDSVKKEDAKLVLIQLPDGLKPFADQIHAEMTAACPGVQFVYWADSCFGACDAPLHVRHLGFDLLIAFGHAPWRS